jgi:hypothetical protein
MKKTKTGSDSTSYFKKKIEGSNKIIQKTSGGTPTGMYAGKSLVKGTKELAKAENKKAGVSQPKKNFSAGSPYVTKPVSGWKSDKGMKLPNKKLSK